jgi:putative ABC transport system permease protein
VLVEVEDGQRQRLTLPVADVVSELRGMNAYIERRSLNRLLQEGDVLNRVTLLVDRGHEPELLQRMQQIPLVAAAFSKASMLANVQGITARNLRIISAVLTVFASVIAVGVVYNQVRIALAERAWELASLRVLGFTRAEVSSILLGEIALEILLAVPLGMLGGLLLAQGMVALIQTDEFFLPAQIQAPTYAYAVLCVVLTGMVSAAIVNRKVRDLDLVGVLKTHE